MIAGAKARGCVVIVCGADATDHPDLYLAHGADVAVQEVEIDRVPEDARKVGALLIAGDPGGEQRPIRVAEVHEDKILLDFNHPLAGQALVFDVTIVGIE